MSEIKKKYVEEEVPWTYIWKKISDEDWKAMYDKSWTAFGTQEDMGWDGNEDFACMWRQKTQASGGAINEIMDKLEAKDRAGAPERRAKVPKCNVLKSRTPIVQKFSTVEAVMDRPEHMPPPCVDVRASFQRVSRADFIRLGDDPGSRQALVQQLRDNECKTCPGATLDYLHGCFNELLSGVFAINYDEAYSVKYKDHFMARYGYIPDDKQIGIVGHKSPFGTVQWSRDRIPLVYCFTAFTTLIRLLCLPDTLIEPDNLPVILHAIVFLMIRQDEGLFGDVAPLSAFEKHGQGLFSGKQVLHVAVTLLQALDFTPPHSVDDGVADDIIYYRYSVYRKKGEVHRMELLSDIEHGVVNAWVSRKDGDLRLDHEAFLFLFQDYDSQSTLMNLRGLKPVDPFVQKKD